MFWVARVATELDVQAYVFEMQDTDSSIKIDYEAACIAEDMGGALVEVLLLHDFMGCTVMEVVAI